MLGTWCIRNAQCFTYNDKLPEILNYTLLHKAFYICFLMCTAFRWCYKIQVMYIPPHVWIMAGGSIFRTEHVRGDADIYDDNYHIYIFGNFTRWCGKQWKHTTFNSKRIAFSFRYNGKESFILISLLFCVCFLNSIIIYIFLYFPFAMW